jgi:hypothetical protein
MQGASQQQNDGNDILECRRRSVVLPYMSHDDVRVTHVAELHGVRFSGHLCGSRKSRMSSNVQRVLGDIGQSGVVICYWDAKPFKLAGPIWVEAYAR